MKFTLSIAAYLVIGWILGWGILQAVHGSYWLLIASVVGYLFAFARLGCVSH